MATAAPEIPVLARDQAFESMYRRYVTDVYRYSLALLRNPADAEDVTQTTFLNAYRAVQRGIEVEKPHNWLIKIAHNVARTRYARASRRVKEVPLEDHVEQLAVAEPDRPDVVAVLRALGGLPLNQRAALVMRELEGRTYAEIADTIGVSVSAVETLIFRARKSLRIKASALRVLAAVPLPSSLSQFFEGSGAIAGGGAAVGTSFLLKAAVALVAGAVATGVSKEQGGMSAEAAKPAPRIASIQSLPVADGLTTRPVARLRAARGARVAPVESTGVVATTGAVGTKQAPATVVRAPVSGQPDLQTGTTTIVSTTAAVASQLPSQASTVASAVESALPAVSLPVPAPVEAPALPPVDLALQQVHVAPPLP